MLSQLVHCREGHGLKMRDGNVQIRKKSCNVRRYTLRQYTRCYVDTPEQCTIPNDTKPASCHLVTTLSAPRCRPEHMHEKLRRHLPAETCRMHRRAYVAVRESLNRDADALCGFSPEVGAGGSHELRVSRPIRFKVARGQSLIYRAFPRIQACQQGVQEQFR